MPHGSAVLTPPSQPHVHWTCTCARVDSAHALLVRIVLCCVLLCSVVFCNIILRPTLHLGCSRDHASLSRSCTAVLAFGRVHLTPLGFVNVACSPCLRRCLRALAAPAVWAAPPTFHCSRQGQHAAPNGVTACAQWLMQPCVVAAMLVCNGARVSLP